MEKKKGKRIDTAVSFPCLTKLITELHRATASYAYVFNRRDQYGAVPVNANFWVSKFERSKVEFV